MIRVFIRSSQSFDIEMLLPVQNNAPDYQYMTTLISAVQKLVIKNVVEYAGNKF